MSELAFLFSAGLGGERDDRKATELFRQAASLDDDYAEFSMGLRCFWGSNTKQDYGQAFKYFQASAKHKRGDAECLLSHLYEEGLGVAKNPELAKHFRDLAKQHGCTTGEYQIGRTYLQGRGTPQNFVKAYYWLRKAADEGHEHAMNDIGMMYANGNGVTRDDKKALEWYLKAEKKGCPYAKFNLAERYRTGKGMPKNLTKARALYKESAQLGSQEAAEMLKRLESH